MSKLLLDLEDVQITDTGNVLVKYDTLFRLFRDGRHIEGLTTLDHEDVRLYNMKRPETSLDIEHLTGIEEAPSIDAYRFNIPERYFNLDIDEYLADKLIDKFPDVPDIYTERLCLELGMMREREMEDLLRVLIYICEKFEQNNVVYGVGRGSACSSLVLYLIGIHMVDPVLHDIPIGEFLR
jgi:DNA polymerase III alpha subunit